MKKAKKAITNLQLVLTIAIIAIVVVGSVAYILWTRPPPEEEEEKVLIVGTTEEYLNPDIVMGGWGLDKLIERNRAEKLLLPDLTEPGVYQPCIAESWKLENATGSQPYVEFKIRHGLKFQDGEPITASAVKWSWEREPDIDEGHRYFHETSYTKLVVIDDYTLRMYLHTPPFIPHPFSCLFIMSHAYVISPRLDKNVTGMEVVGSGPFKLVEYVAGERLVLERWDDYPDIRPALVTHPAYADKVIIKFYADPISMRLGLETGEIDIAWKDLTKQDLVSLQANPDVTVEVAPSGYKRFLSMSWQIMPFNDTRVRRAIAYALNVKEIMDATQLGFAELCKSPLYSWMDYYTPYFDQVYNQSYSNIEKAKELLAEAGYPNGFTTELWYTDHFDSYVAEGQVATVMTSQLAEAGITAVPKQVEWALFYDKMNQGAIPGLALQGWGLDFPDPDNLLYFAMASKNHTGLAWRWHRYENLTADALLDEGRELYDPTIPPEQNTERKAVYEKLQEMYADDVVHIPLWGACEYEAYRSNVKGYHICWTGVLKALYNAYKEEWGITPIEDWDIFEELSSSSGPSASFGTSVYSASFVALTVPSIKLAYHRKADKKCRG